MFYVMFEDTLMRLFATDHVTKVLPLNAFGLKEGEMIESGMVTRAIERRPSVFAWKKTTGAYAKRLLEYDDVMNKQRTYIYSRDAIMPCSANV